MKKITPLIIVLIVLLSNSCSDYMNLEPQSDISDDFLYTEPEGLKNAVVGLYDKNRDIYNNLDAENTRTLHYFVLHDLVVGWESYLRVIARWSPLAMNPDSYYANHLRRNWRHYYTLIDRANAIIEGAEEIKGMDEEERLKVLGEAKVFRANSLLILWQLFNNVYISTKPTTPENASERILKPNTKEEILTQVASDFEDAIKYLPWTDEEGRVTRALAYHLRAKVALWQEDWRRAADCADSVITHPNYNLVDIDEVFTGDRNHEESLFTIQLSKGVPGGGSDNMIASTFNADYNKVSGASYSNEQGGRGLGFVFPNNYLLGLYEENDRRLDHYYIMNYVYNDPLNIPDSVLISLEDNTYAYPEEGDTIILLDTNQYYRNIHPSIKKYFDDEAVPASAVSQKNIIAYRLAETYIIAAESYMRMNNQTEACDRINAIRQRSGILDDLSSLDEDELMKEHARELAFEGQRFFFLKRLGNLVSQVRMYIGDDGVRDLGRENIEEHMINLPIPTTELELLGPEYPQNDGY